MIVRVTTQNHIFVYRVLFYFFLSTFIGMLFEDLFKKFPAFLLCSSLKKSFKRLAKTKENAISTCRKPISRCSTTRSVYSKYNILHYLSHTKLLERLYRRKKLASENNRSKKKGKRTVKNSYTCNL